MQEEVVGRHGGRAAHLALFFLVMVVGLGIDQWIG